MTRVLTPEQMERRRQQRGEYRQRPEVKARRAEQEKERRRRNGIGPRVVNDPDDVRLARNARRREAGKTERDREYMRSYRQMPYRRQQASRYRNREASDAWLKARVQAFAAGESAGKRWTAEEDAIAITRSGTEAAAILGRPIRGIYQRRALLKRKGML